MLNELKKKKSKMNVVETSCVTGNSDSMIIVALYGDKEKNEW